MTIRIRDVAKIAGVSPTTVSRFVNDQIRLPEATRRRIRLAIELTGYRPNLHARRLSTGRSDSIGLVIPDIANPFFARLAAAVEDEADARRLELSLFVTLNRPGRERAYIEALARNQVDGLIFATNHAEHDLLRAQQVAPGRMVLVDEDVPGLPAPRVFCDNYGGGLLVGRHLAALGHRRVAYLGAGPELMSGRLRLAGLRAGLAEGAHVVEALCSYTREGGAAAASRLAARETGVTAIFAAADEVAIGVLQVLRERGLRVPDDFSLVGFDDVEPLHLFDPPITAVRQPIDAIGRHAVDLLAAPEDGPERQGEMVLPVELVERASCAPVT